MDLGLNGFSVWGTEFAPRGEFEVSVPLDDDLAPLVGRARIARQFVSDGGAVWGLEFVDPSPEARYRLRNYVERHQAA